MSRFGFNVKFKARGRTTRRVAGEMNKAEAQYEREVLAAGVLAGEYLGFSFETHTFKLGKDLRYTPDFAVQRADGTMEFHEVKAGTKDGKPRIEDDARVKLITAAEMLPYTFVMVWWHRDYGWQRREM